MYTYKAYFTGCLYNISTNRPEECAKLIINSKYFKITFHHSDQENFSANYVLLLIFD